VLLADGFTRQNSPASTVFVASETQNTSVLNVLSCLA
jgi:hypothetical protein